MSFLRFGMIVAASGWVAMAQSRPEPPDLLSFEGTLVVADGSVVGGTGTVNYPMVFRLFDRVQGGQLLWTEQQTVSVTQGLFGTLLGEGNAYANEPRPPLSSVFRSARASDVYVEVTVRGVGTAGADATVTPRTRLASGAFSLLATHARTAQELVNRNGQPVVTPVGNRVGINRSNPSATLDVGGSMAVSGVSLSGNVTGGGNVEAAAFHGMGMAPVRTIVMWTGSTPPRGWVLCDGSVVAGVQTPDLRGRFVLGEGNGPGLSPRPMHSRGGTEAHALTVDQIPSHNHRASFRGNVSDGRSGAHEYRVALGGSVAIFPYGNDGSQANSQIGTVSSSHEWGHHHNLDVPGFHSSPAGEGRPHNTMPPYYVLAFIMRVQ